MKSPEKKKPVLRETKLVEAIRKKFGASTALIPNETDTVSKVTGYIPTGLDVLDHYVLGGGGLPEGKISEVFADEGLGKAQPLDAHVLTPTGFTSIGELAIGDSIIGVDGCTQHVVGVYPRGRRTVFRVETSDGGATECCAEHLWSVRTPNDVARGTSRVLTTEAMIGLGLRESHGAWEAWRFKIPTVAPVHYEEPVKLPLHPYLLGALLGDGGLTSASLVFTKPEMDVLDRVEALLPTTDKAVRFGGDSLRVVKRTPGSAPSETARIIRELGLAVTGEKKFVPDVYLRASPENRLELLRGLFDTDGSVTPAGGVDFAVTSFALTRAVVELVRGLGGLASEVVAKEAGCFYKGKWSVGATAYRTHVQFGDALVPVASRKHLTRWRAKAWPAHRSIVAITPVGEKECVCIRVSSPEQLYVSDDYIVTHNSSLAYTAIAAAQRADASTVLWDPELTFDDQRAATLGVDLSRLVYEQPAHLEELIEMVKLTLRTHDGKVPFLGVWDSIASTNTKQGLSMEAGKSRVGDVPLLLSNELKKILLLLHKKRAHLLMVNQTRQKIGVIFGSNITTPGGNAPKFYAWQRLWLMGGKAVKIVRPGGKKEHVGKIVSVAAAKNKTVPPWRRARLLFRYSSGYSNEWSTIQHAIEMGVMKSDVERNRAGYLQACEKLGWLPAPEELEARGEEVLEPDEDEDDS